MCMMRRLCRLVRRLTRPLLHASGWSVVITLALFTLLWLAGAGVPLSLVLAKAGAWAAFGLQLALAAVRKGA